MNKYKQLLNWLAKTLGTRKPRINTNLPDGRVAAQEWVKRNPDQSLRGTSADFEVSWANWLRNKGLTNQNPGKVRSFKELDIQNRNLGKPSSADIPGMSKGGSLKRVNGMWTRN